MPRINIDDELRVDPRFNALCSLVPRNMAFGAIVCVWELGQVYWKRKKSLIPPKLAEATPNYAELVQCGLIEVHENGVYCVGAEERWAFLLVRSEAGKIGGERSAKIRRELYGSAVPLGATNFEAKSEAKPSKPNPSSSSSSSKELNTIGHRSAQADPPEGFFGFWESYPRKIKRTEALKRFKQTVKPSDFEDLMRALKAFRSHHATARTEVEFIPYPTTFLGTKSAPSWRDWLLPAAQPKRESGMSDEEFEHFNGLAQQEAAWLKSS